MKKTSIRSIVSMLVIFFAVSATSCQKENEIAPENPGAAPATPPVVAVPPVSFQPKSIVTTHNGATVRTQTYLYDAQGKLSKYVSKSGNIVDSVILSANSVSFKSQNASVVSQVLTFNDDKTFKSVFMANAQVNFQNNVRKLSRILENRNGGAFFTAGVVNYTNDNMVQINAEATININYHDNLPYQKGINELPVFLKPLQYFKVMEQENISSMQLYNKLVRQVIIDFGNRRDLHDFAYTFDSNNRVTKITDTFTIVTNTTSTQKILISNIVY